jgi:DNA replication protein DnaC
MSSPESLPKSLTTEINSALKRATEQRQQPERPNSEVHCFMRQLASDLGARYSPDRVSLKTYRCDCDAQRNVMELIRGLAARLPEVIANGENLVLYGSVGTGKDHLLAALLYTAAWKGHSARWVDGREFFASIRDTMDSQQPESPILQRWTAPAVLGISDPIAPGAVLSAWNLEQLARLIDRRYRARRPTWLTANAKDEVGLKAALSMPVYDRLRHDAHVIHCYWRSYRGQPALSVVPEDSEAV